MTGKEPRTLSEMASDAVGTGLLCPKCQCQNFKVYGSAPGKAVVFRYKQCRNCGHRILTSTESKERIVRDVSPHDSLDDEDESSVRLKIAK